MLHTPEEQEIGSQSNHRSKELRIVDKRNQRKFQIGHMATLAKEKSFYRNLKLNCIDHKRIQYQLRQRDQPSPGPGDYVVAQGYQQSARSNQAPPEKISTKKLQNSKRQVFKSVFKKDPPVVSPLDNFTNQKIKDGVIGVSNK